MLLLYIIHLFFWSERYIIYSLYILVLQYWAITMNKLRELPPYSGDFINYGTTGVRFTGSYPIHRSSRDIVFGRRVTPMIEGCPPAAGLDMELGPRMNELSVSSSLRGGGRRLDIERLRVYDMLAEATASWEMSMGEVMGRAANHLHWITSGSPCMYIHCSLEL